MMPLFTSLLRAFASQLHVRMLLLTLLPLLIGLGLWGLLLWQGLQPLIDQLHQWFSHYALFKGVGERMDRWGLSAIRTLMVPLLAIWLYLLVFVFSGLWFQHYCLDALARVRSVPMTAVDPDRIIDIN